MESSRPPRRSFSRGGGSRPGGRGGGRGRGGPRGNKPDPPMLLGEPSPSLLRIQAMNMEKLAAKIIQLGEEQVAIKAKVERLEARDPQPTEQIEGLKTQIERLATLQKLASERLEKKKTRKAEWDRKNAR